MGLNSDAEDLTISVSLTLNPNVTSDEYIITITPVNETTPSDPIVLRALPEDIIDNKIEETVSSGVQPETTYVVTAHSTTDDKDSKPISQQVTTGKVLFCILF